MRKTLSQAHPLLLSGYEGMNQPEDKIPGGCKQYVKKNLQHPVQLYEATGQSEKTIGWKTKLAEYDKSEAEKKALVLRP